MKKNIFNNDISVIKEAINTDRLVIFAGAGISKDSGIPLWSELVKGIKGRLNEEINEKDSLKIAQMLYNEKGEKEYNDILTNLLFRNSISYNPIQELIFDLNPQHIVTTNFDMFFETIINDEGLPFSIVSRDSDLPYAKHKKMLIKYHGDFNNNNIVLKENDYLEFSKNHTLKEVFVKSLFSNKVILFVGYSVSDSNLKFLIREIQYILKKDYQKAYFLDIEEKRSNTEIKYFENLGVNVINIDNSNINFLEKKLNSSLSDKGNKLFYLLEYIRDFKLYQYRNLLDVNSTRTKIIKEYFNSIYRFKYFRILPLKTLANLYPINKDSNIDNPLYNIHNATLKIFDKDFYKLISDYTGDRDENFTDEENYQLKFILNRIYSSGILKLGRVDKPDNWGNYRIKEEIDLLDKIKSDFTCDCINCTLNSLNYSVGLNKIFKYNIDNKTELWDDLVYAYGLYQTKDFYKYFLALKSIITKSNKLEKLEVSFIAKYNLKRLKFSIINELQNKRLDFDDIENIEKEIDKINLDEELDKVKYFVDHDIFNFLKEIKDGAYLQRLCNKIDEIFLKVPQNVETIEKGGSHSDNAFQELYQNALKLHNFLNFNFLLGNRFSPIESTLKKSINTFILGYYLKKFVEPSKKSFFSISHIHSFDIFLFNLIINYGEDKELVKLLEEQEICEIEISDDNLLKICDKINNYLKSPFNEPKNNHFSPSRNTLFFNHITNNASFKNEYLRKFKLICVVISYFKISNKQFNEIYLNIIKFIKFIPFTEDDFSRLNLIYDKREDFLSNEDLISTLEEFDDKRFINLPYISILDMLHSRNKEFIHNNLYADSLNIEKFKFYFPTVYKVLSKPERKKFEKQLVQFLSKNSYIQLYYLAISSKILKLKSVKNDYKNLINTVLIKNLEGSKSQKNYYRFLVKQFFDLVYRGLIDTNGIDKNNIKEKQFLFLLEPEKFKPEDINNEWIKYYDGDSFCKKFAKIDSIKFKIQQTLKNKYNEDLGRIFFKMKANE